MGAQIAVRLDDAELGALDAEVAQGRANNRSDAVRHSIARLQREQRYRSEEAVLVALTAQGEAVYPDFDGLRDLRSPDLD